MNDDIPCDTARANSQRLLFEFPEKKRPRGGRVWIIDLEDRGSTTRAAALVPG